MNRKRVLVAGMGVAVSFFAVCGALQAADMAPAERIKIASDPGAATSTYNTGCETDKDNKDLHIAYMRRMLQFGMPVAAGRAARTLTIMDPANGMAQGVMGLVFGKQNQCQDSLVASLRAYAKLPDDPSIQNNLGQMIAWYENGNKDANIPDDAAKTLKGLLGNIPGGPMKKSYDSAKASYDQFAKQKKTMEDQVASAEADLKTSNTNGQAAEEAYNKALADITEAEKKVSHLKYSLRQLEDSSGGRRASNQMKDILHGQIKDAQQDVGEAQTKARAAQTKLQAAITDKNKKDSTLKDLQRQLRLMIDRTKYTWLPPAVDGVVTPENSVSAKGSLLDSSSASSGSAASAPAGTADENASLATQRLALAKSYLANGLKDKAEGMFNEIIKKYPGTQAAKDAAELLKTMKAAETPKTE